MALYWILPIISACTWIGMLLAMLIVWEVEGSPYYPSFSPGQRIAYISDIGAQGLKPLFIAGCCVTTIFLDLSFFAERWLRHTGQLQRNTTRLEKILSGFAITFAVAGTAGLILLSIFDTLRHPHLHDGFLLLFVGGYVISAIFLCAEYQRLGKHYRSQRMLRISFWIKLVFIIVEVVLAIAFAVCTFDNKPNVGAILEWTIALIFTFWVLSFLVDLLPAARRSAVRKPGQDVEMDGMANVNGHMNGHAHANGAYVNGNAQRHSRMQYEVGNGLGPDREYIPPTRNF
ncbi:hypothetical protein MMC25_002512 [Agyrium rufum]|nr:hypothetical protein [Agyrium rufum]